MVQPIMIEYNFGYVIPDPKRPGPDYYQDCEKFNWASKLIESHKEHISSTNQEDVYKIEYTPEEIAIMQKLKEESGLKVAVSAVASLGLGVISLL